MNKLSSIASRFNSSLKETHSTTKFDIESWVYDPKRTREELEDAHHELTKDVYGVSSSSSPTNIEELRFEIIELQQHVDNLSQRTQYKEHNMKLATAQLRRIIKEEVKKVLEAPGMSSTLRLKGDPDRNVKEFLNSQESTDLLDGAPQLSFDDVVDLIDMDLPSGESMMQQFIVSLSLDDTGSNTVEADDVDINDTSTWGTTDPSDVPPIEFFNVLHLTSRLDVKRRASRAAYEFT